MAAGTLEALALELGKALTPLKDILDTNYFNTLGLDLPREVAADANLQAKLAAARTAAGDIEDEVQALISAIAAEAPVGIVTAGASLIASFAAVANGVDQVATALDAAANAAEPAVRAQLKSLATRLWSAVLHAAAVAQLSARLPDLTTVLAAIGLVDQRFTPTGRLDVNRSSRDPVPPRIHLDRLPALISDPVDYLKQTFHWNQADFDAGAVMRRLQELIEGLGLPAAYYPTPAPHLEAFAFALGTDGQMPPGLKAEVSLPGNVDHNETINFSALWKGTVKVKAAYAAGAEVTLRPPFTLSAKPLSGSAQLDLALGLEARKSAADPIMLFGMTGGTGLSAEGISASVGLSANLSPAGGALEPSAQLTIDKGKLKIDFSEGDGFLQTLLRGVNIEGPFGLAADWRPSSGLRLQGQGGIEIFIPAHADLKLAELKGLYFSLGLGGAAPLEIGLAAQISANIGPLQATVDRMGLSTLISFPPGGGNLGLADIKFKFAPPKGVGLALDTGVIKGGGFLYLDPDKGEYFGALELSFEGIIALKAIGIINTKMPDGKPGFSLLILITAEFIPLQLGFGFTLNGVGGLLGANRTTNLDALRSGVRTGAVSSILFPKDIVANIGRIISDLKAIFPIQEGHFIIGPMAKLGWGTPPLITLELGIIIEIPSPRIVILGVLRCILPAEDAPILKLQVNFAGGIDFEEGLIWFDASLFDSSLLVYTLTGDMALRIGWKDPVFILSVGGFHPAFKEIPPDLTGMKRMMISLLSGDNPRLSCSTYFAVTSNTVQNGARVELYAEACGFNVYGFIGYDLLVQFNPFHLLAEIAAGLALREGRNEIAGIHVRAELSGPTPWHAQGEGSLSFLFFEISVGFSVTWGDEGPQQALETEDVLKLMFTAVNDNRNWKADNPPNATQGVTLRKHEPGEDQDVLLHPFGILAVSQKIAPLGLPINKFGNKKPGPDTLFELTSAAGGTEEVKEEFAPAYFLQMSDSDKVARKSFEKMRSGLRLTPANEIQHGFEIQKEVNYELSYVSPRTKSSLKAGIYRMVSSLFSVLAPGGSIGRNAHAVAQRKATIAPAKVEVVEARYHVVNVDDLSVHGGLTAASQAEAYALQADAIAREPGLHGALQVVADFELAA